MSRAVPDDVLAAIRSHFHRVIAKRAEEFRVVEKLDLPTLESCPRSERSAAWFRVPGMYGGFRYWLEGSGPTAKLITESWCRIMDESGQRHEITADGARLVDEGFV